MSWVQRIKDRLLRPWGILVCLHLAGLGGLIALGFTRPLLEPVWWHWLATAGYASLLFALGRIDARRNPAAGGDAAGAVLGVTALKLRKSTAELREARETLRANERLFTLGMLSAGIAHEIKNPVAAIIASVKEAPGMVTDLETAIEKGEPVGPLIGELRGVAEDCEHAGRQLQRIAMDLNNMVRGGATQVRSLEPTESLQGVARMLRKAAGNEVEVQVTCDATLHVLADPGRLMQVLLNLAGNAIDAMRAHGGGTLRLDASDIDGEHIRFTVADTGPGMPPEVQERMYDPFYTTKGPGQGTGLGLHLVSEIVHAQRGTIRCESTVGHGTTFLVELPAVPPKGMGDGNHEGRNEASSDRGRRGDDSSRAGSHAAA